MITGSRKPFSANRHRRMAQEALFIVRAYYAFSVVVAFILARKVWETVQAQPDFAARWPVAWIPDSLLVPTSKILIVALLAASIISAFLHDRRAPRIIYFLVLLQLIALQFSFGFTNHAYHIWLWMSFWLIFVPPGSPEILLQRRRSRHEILAVFAWLTGTVLLFYTLSGLSKLAATVPMQASSISSLAPGALAHLVLNRVLETGEFTVLAEALATYPLMGWPAYVGVIYLEVIALLALFRPALLVPLGLFLMMFHMGIWLLMGIHFPFQPLQALLLLVWSPFRPSRFSARQTFEQLPGVGPLIAYMREPGEQNLVRYWWVSEWPAGALLFAIALANFSPMAIRTLS